MALKASCSKIFQLTIMLHNWASKGIMLHNKLINYTTTLHNRFLKVSKSYYIPKFNVPNLHNQDSKVYYISSKVPK